MAPTSYISTSSNSECSTSNAALYWRVWDVVEKVVENSQELGLLHPCGCPRRSSWVLMLDQPCFSHHNYLGSEPVHLTFWHQISSRWVVDPLPPVEPGSPCSSLSCWPPATFAGPHLTAVIQVSLSPRPFCPECPLNSLVHWNHAHWTPFELSVYRETSYSLMICSFGHLGYWCI